VERYFSHPIFSYFSPTTPTKLKRALQICGKVVPSSNPLELNLPNQKQGAVKKYNFAVFIRLSRAPPRLWRLCIFSGLQASAVPHPRFVVQGHILSPGALSIPVNLVTFPAANEKSRWLIWRANCTPAWRWKARADVMGSSYLALGWVFLFFPSSPQVSKSPWPDSESIYGAANEACRACFQRSLLPVTFFLSLWSHNKQPAHDADTWLLGRRELPGPPQFAVGCCRWVPCGSPSL
jgi:hypothetical protein